MKIKLTSVYVDDQEKALRFYTEVLGFVKKADFSQGPYRWLTVASPEDPDGTELQLALNDNPAAKAYQQAIFQQRPARGHVLHRRRAGRIRADESARRRVHHATNGRDRLQDRHAERHLRQSHSGHAVAALRKGVSGIFCIHARQGRSSVRVGAVRPQPLVCVTDVEASSRWYQRLLGCRGAHGGRHYEQLVKDGSLILQLHSFEVEHHHGPIGNRADKPYGNGVLLWFEVDDFDAAMNALPKWASRSCWPAIVTLPKAKAAPTTGSVGCATRMATSSWSPALMDPPTVPGAQALIYSARRRRLLQGRTPQRPGSVRHLVVLLIARTMALGGLHGVVLLPARDH